MTHIFIHTNILLICIIAFVTISCRKQIQSKDCVGVIENSESDENLGIGLVHKSKRLVRMPHHIVQHFGVLFDAGSSSTKLKVYRYIDGHFPFMVPDVCLVFYERVKPGLSTFVNNLNDVREYLHNAINLTKIYIPFEQRNTTSIFLYATAGFRILSSSTALKLLNTIRSALSDRMINPFQFEDKNVAIISGEEEAVYAWLAVNYLNNFFSNETRAKNSIGILEMGGGSLQVAFIPNEPLYESEFQVYIGTRRYDLYAHSYLGFGSNYLKKQVLSQLIKQYCDGEMAQLNCKNGNSTLISDPCMLSGDTREEISEEFGNITVEGYGSIENCEALLTKILHLVGEEYCLPHPCSIGGEYQPAVGKKRFTAFSAFIYAPRVLEALTENCTLQIRVLRTQARQYCSLTVEEATERTGSRKFVSDNCLLGQYIPILLTGALGFHEDTNTITVSDRIDNRKIDWTLGAMLQHLSMAFMDNLQHGILCHRGDTVLPGNRPPSSADNIVNYSLSLLFKIVICILFVLMYTVY